MSTYPTETPLWKAIPEFDDYKINQFGNVVSMKYGKEKPVKAHLTKSVTPYLVVTLCKQNVFSKLEKLGVKVYRDKSKKSKGPASIVTKRVVHALVATLFVEKPYGVLNAVVIHKNGNSLDNDYRNLQWISRADSTRLSHKRINDAGRTRDDVSKLPAGAKVFQDGAATLNVEPGDKGPKGWYIEYDGNYCRIINTGKTLLFKAKRSDGTWATVSLAPYLMEKRGIARPSKSHNVGFKDFDYTNIARTNMIWETKEEKGFRWWDENPIQRIINSEQSKSLHSNTMYDVPRLVINMHKMFQSVKEGKSNLESVARKLKLSYWSVYRKYREWNGKDPYPWVVKKEPR